MIAGASPVRTAPVSDLEGMPERGLWGEEARAVLRFVLLDDAKRLGDFDLAPIFPHPSLNTWLVAGPWNLDQSLLCLTEHCIDIALRFSKA